MKKRRLVPDTRTYGGLFSAFAHSNGEKDLLEKVVALRDEVLRRNVVPTVYMYNSLLKTFMNLEEWPFFDETLESMKKAQVPCDAVTMTIRLKAIRLRGQYGQTASLFEQTLADRLMDQTLLDSFLTTCYHSEDKVLLRLSKDIFESALEQDVRPKIYTYKVLLGSLRRCGETKLAMKYAQRVLQNSSGRIVEVQLVNEILRAFLAVGKIVEGLELSKTFVGKIDPDATTLNVSLHLAVAARDIGHVSTLVQRMRQKAFRIDAVLVPKLVDCARTAGRQDLVHDLAGEDS